MTCWLLFIFALLSLGLIPLIALLVGLPHYIKHRKDPPSPPDPWINAE